MKPVIYQVLPRLYGNRNATCKPDGTIFENGCGKMNDFTPEVLKEIRLLGATHIWYTGLIAHATKTDYSQYGLPKNDGSVVKGMAGSPYAIRDYYDVDPDLAVDVPHRMDEFQQLVWRTHKEGLKFILDFVPNHVAREYLSLQCPKGIEALGAEDDTSQSLGENNNFYYLPGDTLQIGTYTETPAKVTGNDVWSSRPGENDWYETVKLNYHSRSTWQKMLDILLFWAGKGVDAFRCDMAEMVPVAFWEWAVPKVKERFPNLIFIAEVYNPSEYRNYVYKGHFDYLYDKVGLYDTLRGVMCGWISAQEISRCWQRVDDIREHMLYFLENHDEQRLASDYFAGDAGKGKPALLVSALMGKNPMMVYFGQELGERGMDEEGFSGKDGRTTIFDYWSLGTMRRLFEGNLSEEERTLREFYRKILHLCNEDEVFREGEFYDLMYMNPHLNRQYAFLRRCRERIVLVVANFEEMDAEIDVFVPRHVYALYHLPGDEKLLRVHVPANDGLILDL